MISGCHLATVQSLCSRPPIFAEVGGAAYRLCLSTRATHLKGGTFYKEYDRDVGPLCLSALWDPLFPAVAACAGSGVARLSKTLFPRPIAFYVVLESCPSQSSALEKFFPCSHGRRGPASPFARWVHYFNGFLAPSPELVTETPPS